MSKRKIGFLGLFIAIILIYLVVNNAASDKVKTVGTPKKQLADKTTENVEQKLDSNPKQDNSKDEVKKEDDMAVENSSSKSENTKETTKKQIPVTLTRSVDGDTIKVMYKGKEETIRYLLVDTPESKKPGTCVQPYAESASDRNKQLVNSGQLTIEFDNGNERDKYGRLLAYVFVNGKSVQESLLKEGFARVAYIYEPTYKYLDQYRADEDYAQNKNVNIWSNSGLVTDKGFNGCAAKSTVAKKSGSSSTASSNSVSNPSPTPPPSTGDTEFFSNCTELRQKYPNGVPSSHPAYQSKMDRDHDQYACE